MEQTKQYVNLGISPETRAKVNLLKAQIEMSQGESITTDELINMMLESTSIEMLAALNTKPVPA